MDEIRRRFREVGTVHFSLKSAIAEMLGTAIFLLVGLSLTATFLYEAKLDHLHSTSTTGMMAGFVLIGLSYGIPICFMIYAIAHLSGGHINPAVTLAMIGAGITPVVQGIANMIAQVLGSMIAAALLWVLMPHYMLKGTHIAGCALPPHVHPLGAFLGEIVATGCVIYVILETVCHPKSKVGAAAPLAIGLAFSFLIAAFIPISGGALNPARCLGPAIVSFHYKHIWVWIFGPLVGACWAVPLHVLSVSNFDTVVSIDEEHGVQVSREGDVEEPLIPAAGNQQ